MQRRGAGGRVARTLLAMWAIAVMIMLALMFLGRGGDAPVDAGASLVWEAEAFCRG